MKRALIVAALLAIAACAEKPEKPAYQMCMEVVGGDPVQCNEGNTAPYVENML